MNRAPTLDTDIPIQVSARPPVRPSSLPYGDRSPLQGPGAGRRLKRVPAVGTVTPAGGLRASAAGAEITVEARHPVRHHHALAIAAERPDKGDNPADESPS
jgi:hypothetical protein